LTRTRIVWLSVIGVIALIVIVTGVLVIRQPQAGLNGTSLPALKPMIASGTQTLYVASLLNYTEYRANSGRWSFAYFGCTFGAAILSAMASVILKLDLLASRDALRKDLAAISAALAALLITLATMGRFEEKWRANRLAASAMENTAYDLAKPGADETTNITAIITQMQEINKVRDDAVVAKLASTSQPAGDHESKRKQASPLPAEPQQHAETPKSK